MKLIDYISDIIESGDLKKMTHVRSSVVGNETLLPSHILPFDRHEAVEARELLIAAIKKLGR